ncbi:retrovirus-related Pol polyprotein from type-2 retrotransposable element R2DM [Caerostris darwini]|uniref:Retrovirus-related Pol polyprotein from type-2 retrotransposable element R2DM n=1 Tax=Caerostris darwini TaxID=1538125 RepID=A0AAV4QWE3_9ARAC|nr:retrovirus-related Pol polyprotein from type-2 retrotransposable element R2DM [Caerostris darwini]
MLTSVHTCQGILKTNLLEDRIPKIVYEDLIIKPQHRRRILFSIRDRRRMNRSSQLLNKISQGKALKLVSLSPSISHFMSDGTCTRFADWRFIHRARLNLVPLNGCQPFKTGEDKMCRRCGQCVDTLPHVVNHCSLHSHGWQLRHNAIADRIVKALQPKATILSINQNVCDTNSYESKITKYEPLLPPYHAQGLNPVIVPILVGALGSWFPWCLL